MDNYPKKTQWRCLTLILVSVFSMILTNCSSSEKKSTPAKTKQVKKTTKKKAGKSKAINLPPDPFYKNKTLDKIYRRQAKRMKRIDSYKKKGVVGEADNGMLKIRDVSKLGSKEKAFVNKMVSVENKDRLRIILAAGKGAVQKEEDFIFIRRRLFRYYQAMDSPGTYFFEANHWRKK